MQLALRIKSGKLKETRLFFSAGQYLFGRAPGCHVLFAPSSIASRRHCLLLVANTGVQVRDLGSSNGTFVNNQRLSGEQRLSHGDLLRVGETTFVVEITVPGASDSALGAEVSGKPLGETIDVPCDRTAHETKLP